MDGHVGAAIGHTDIRGSEPHILASPEPRLSRGLLK